MNDDLPIGIYYEPTRDRYRVRLYKFSKITHCSYHTDLEDAQKALTTALLEREDVRRVKPRRSKKMTVANLLRDLTDHLRR